MIKDNLKLLQHQICPNGGQVNLDNLARNFNTADHVCIDYKSATSCI